MKTEKSLLLFEKAQKFIPGGVNSPVRAFKSVGGNPIFIQEANGSKIWDVDGNKYIDYVCSWGPLILGHSHPKIVSALKRVVAKGTSYGAPTGIEVKLAQLITKVMPSMEMVRMVNSGTEATMSAIRVARAFTKKNKIIKFEGCYHGHGDSFLVKAGSGALTFGIPDSPGVPSELAGLTLNATYNDISSVEKLVESNKDEISAMIVEPVVGNMGVVIPQTGFLRSLRKVCDENKIVLIFDEVITGFRLSLGGAQGFYDVKPDLTTLGKIIGGGLPVGAYGGKKEIMEMVAPVGSVYQAGTLSGNPLAMTAGYYTLLELTKKNFYKNLEKKARYLADGIESVISSLQVPVRLNRSGSMMTMFFTDKEVIDYQTAIISDRKKHSEFFHALLKRKIYFPPAQFEAFFISSAHTKGDLDKTIKAIDESLKEVF